MGFVVGVPLLVFLVPLCLVIALRKSRWWWLPGAATFAAGVVIIAIVAATGTRHGGGGLPLAGVADLVGIFGYFLVLCGAICFVIGTLTSRAQRQPPPPPAVPRTADPPRTVPRAYVVDLPPPPTT